MEGFKMLDILTILNSDLFSGIANGSQIYDVVLNLKQVSNDELMKELQHQNQEFLTRHLEQNEIIISQNEEIIKKLNNIINTLLSQKGEQNVE